MKRELDASDQGSSESSGEDLYGDEMEGDYRPIPHLDAYDSGQVDDEEYEPLAMDIRRMVDEELNRRDGIEEFVQPEFLFADQRELEPDQYQPTSDSFVEKVEILPSNVLCEIGTSHRSLREFVMIENCRKRIARDFQVFLNTYTDEHGYSIYHERIHTMCSLNQESLEISYDHLADSNISLVKFLAGCPGEVLRIFDETAMKVVLDSFPEYGRIKNEIHVRVAQLPSLEHLRDLRYSHLNTLIRTSGVVTRRTGVFPQLKLIKFECIRCGTALGPFTQDLNVEIKPGSCSTCESKGPFKIHDSQTVYRNYQKITLQESPGSVPAGRLPRHKEVVLLWDLIDTVRPGEEIEVTGLFLNSYSYALNTQHGFPVFATVIEANHIYKRNDQFAALKLTDDDIREIKELGQDPNIGKIIFKSISPSIYGHENIKTAIALSLFGGQAKNINGKMRVRGDINVLMLGDPGTAKSQFLKYVEKTGLRAIYTTGKGASAVGLTASVRKDLVTREWTLEGGALVLADMGVCLIDEFDKMNDADRTSIHEAMEQQSISISKAGIVTSLQARCAIIAAANPIRGRYNPSLTFSQNVNLTDPILSRFDILCVVRDHVDPSIDKLLANFVVNSHMKSTLNAANVWTTDDEVQPLSQTMLRKYLLFAKKNVFPTIQNMDMDKIASLYAELRRESLSSGGIPITVRHIESMVRMAEASARIHLRSIVHARDIDLAVRIMLESFISSQKLSVTKRLNETFSKYLSSHRDSFELLLFTLQELAREIARYYKFKFQGTTAPNTLSIETEDFESRIQKLGTFDVQRFYQSQAFSSHGFRYNDTKRTIELEYRVGQD